MRTFCRALLYCIVLCFSYAYGLDNQTFNNADEFVNSIPNATLEMSATGDVNGDGLKDWVGLILREGDPTSTRQLFILTQLPDGKYIVSEKSVGSEVGGNGSSEYNNLKIIKSSIYVHQLGRGYNNLQENIYQYKLGASLNSL